MEHVSGIEIGVGAYFNGDDFVMPALLDWEHKRFFPGDLGELTGEMGTIVTYRGAEALFQKTLGKMRARLRKAGYCGYINLNLIVNDDGVWPLEFTCRFGYPGFAICGALHQEGWDSILWRLASGGEDPIRTKPGFAAGVVLTVPPFPYELGYDRLSRGTPICFSEKISDREHKHLHFGEMAFKKKQWVTVGTEGYVMVVTGNGSSISEARRKAYDLVGKIAIPNVRYRNDIGVKVAASQFRTLKKMGYVGR